MQMEIGEFFESVNDALKAIVTALGGPKRVGMRMRPELNEDSAKDWVKHCLTPDRREKFSPEQVLWLLREARVIGFHAGMDFIACDVGYKAQPVDVEQQVQSLEETIAQGLQTLNAQMASLTRIKERAGM
jgi:hypothetical protein